MLPVGTYDAEVVETTWYTASSGREFVRPILRVVDVPYVGTELCYHVLAIANFGEIELQARADAMFEKFLEPIEDVTVDVVVRRPNVLLGVPVRVRVGTWTSPTRGPITAVRYVEVRVCSPI